MRIKLTLLTLLLSFSSIVIFAQTPSQTPAGSAQAPTASVTDKRKDMKDLTQDVRYKRREEAKRRHDLKDGNKAGVERTTKNIKKDDRDISKDRNDLKADGVKHPVHRAVHRIRHHR